MLIKHRWRRNPGGTIVTILPLLTSMAKNQRLGSTP